MSTIVVLPVSRSTSGFNDTQLVALLMLFLIYAFADFNGL